MKVITQLIRHFWERGVLTPLEVEYLLRHGFARKQDVPGFQPAKTDDPIPVPEELDRPPIPPHEFDLVEESLVRRHSLKRGSHEPHATELTIDDLLERLRAEFDRRETDLESLLSLGMRLQPVTTWQEAAAELHDAPLERFYAELCAGLKSGNVLMGDLWQASDFEPFHRLLKDDEVRGHVVRSYLALLVSSHPSEMGSYAWILKYEEAQTLFNLRVVHERLLGGLCRIYKEQRHLLRHALEVNQDIVQIWSLIILYNAYRDPALGDTPDYGTEYGPVPLPSDPVWRSAWTCALRMDRTAVSEFLVACYDESDRKDLENDESCRRPLMCPVGWRIPDEPLTPAETQRP